MLSLSAVFCIMMYLEQTCKSENVSIGAIFSLDSINGKVSKIVMMAAVDDINSDPSILGGHNLSLHIHDCNYSGFLGIMEALKLMEKDTVAIIGPQFSEMAHPLSIFANELCVPLLSFTALDLALSPKEFPYFFQTAPNDLFQMTAIAELVSYFGWTQVIVIYTYDSTRRNGIVLLADKLAEKRSKISHKVALPLDIKGKESEAKQKLAEVKLMETRVLVLHTSPIFGPNILKIAEQLGMMGNGYVWITTSWLSAILDSQPSPEIFRMAQGIVTFRLHTPDSKRKKAFISRWNQLGKGSVGLNVYGLYAYDTVWLIAHAVEALLHQGNHISFSTYPNLSTIGGNMNLSALHIFVEGKNLHDFILATNFTGVTGPVWFDPDRFLVNPSYDVINIVGSQLRRIGYWSKFGLSVVAPEILHAKRHNLSSASQKLDNVVWPGGNKQNPRGWAFPKGRKLRVGVPYRASFQDFVYLDNQTREVKGYCIDVFLAAIKLLPYAVPYEFVLFGDGFQNPNYTDLVRRVTVGDFDAAVGDIAIVASRTKIVDFTQPYTDSGLLVVVPANMLSSSAWTFLKPFSPHMWAGMAVSLFIIAAVIWILEHKINDKLQGPPRKQLKMMLWFIFSTLFNAHRENTMDTKNTLTPKVLVIWLFVILIVQQSYTASLSSLLTYEQLASPIKGIETLITSTAPIGFQVGSFAENYLNEELNIPKYRLIPLKSPEEYANALKQGKVAAIVDEHPYVNLFLSSHCHFAIAGHKFTKRGWGFAFKKDSPLALDMSTTILKLSENGILRNISDKWLKKKKVCGQKYKIAVYESDQLQPKSFMGLFLICGASSIIALIIHLSLMCRFHGHVPREPEPSNSGGVQTRCSFSDRDEGSSSRRFGSKRSSTSCYGK